MPDKTYYEGHCITTMGPGRKLDPFDALPSPPPARKRNQPAKHKPNEKQKTTLKASSIPSEDSKGTETYAANLDGLISKAERAFGNCESDFTSPLDKAMFGNPGFDKPKKRSSSRRRGSGDRSSGAPQPRTTAERNLQVQQLVDQFRAAQGAPAPEIGGIF